MWDSSTTIYNIYINRLSVSILSIFGIYLVTNTQKKSDTEYLHVWFSMTYFHL